MQIKRIKAGICDPAFKPSVKRLGGIIQNLAAWFVPVAVLRCLCPVCFRIFNGLPVFFLQSACHNVPPFNLDFKKKNEKL
jgi:hypothetical protein